jgi:hypothetical protein
LQEQAARSSVYRLAPPTNNNNLVLIRRIDELFTACPFLGSRRVALLLRAEKTFGGGIRYFALLQTVRCSM